MSTVAIDARDAFIEPLRGWGRYAKELIGHLPPDLETRVFEHGDIGPEVWFEQVTLPRALRREGAAVVHATNCFLPLRRPCPGVVTIHDLAFEAHPGDFARVTAAKYRFFAPRATRGAQRVICVSEFTAGDVVRRYGVDASKIRVVPNAPSLPIGTAPIPEGQPYLLAVGDLRAKSPRCSSKARSWIVTTPAHRRRSGRKQFVAWISAAPSRRSARGSVTCSNHTSGPMPPASKTRVSRSGGRWPMSSLA